MINKKINRPKIMSDAFSRNLSTEILREKDIKKLSPEERVTKMVQLAKEKTWSKKKVIPPLRAHDYD